MRRFLMRTLQLVKPMVWLIMWEMEKLHHMWQVKVKTVRETAVSLTVMHQHLMVTGCTSTRCTEDLEQRRF